MSQNSKTALKDKALNNASLSLSPLERMRQERRLALLFLNALLLLAALFHLFSWSMAEEPAPEQRPPVVEENRL